MYDLADLTDSDLIELCAGWLPSSKICSMSTSITVPSANEDQFMLTEGVRNDPADWLMALRISSVSSRLRFSLPLVGETS
ncbi:hypothetical protein OGAPHI_007430 [Ogataea philodendri]|uniref:Uncharacterized protein n=1 Tax=Ogataea philodendri TaxID=1378263 RepID=A0A9P8NV15_9ASCO|nr:uncharacterized protein OGAPHI_007430 [Ogataea philodendri]KAH3660225.1 hypothetical protein OGAPHI_007430 [Ogataea philodendri]